MKKKCSDCGKKKLLDDFYKLPHTRDGRQGHCKKCQVVRARRWVENNRERSRTYMKSYRQSNKERRYGNSIQSKFGLSLEEYKALSEKQKGLCAICLSKPKGRSKRLVVDHCHTSKRVRGLLCNTCNRALGMFQDNARTLTRAVAYLKVAQSSSAT
jgi:hypothetical protein